MISMNKSEESRSESFGQFVTRISAYAALGSGAILLFDTTPEIEGIAYNILKYALGTWMLFAAVPFLFKQAWLNRSKINWKWLLSMATSKKASSLEKPKELPSAHEFGSVGSSSEVLISNEFTTTRKDNSFPFLNTEDFELPNIYELLPENPRPTPSSTVTPDIAGEAIRKALELAQFPVEENPDILSIESGPTLQKISFSLPPKVQISKLLQRKEDLANHLGHSKGFDVDSSPYPSSAAFVIPHRSRAFVYVRDIAKELYGFSKKAHLPVVFGKDMVGNPMLVDLTKLPHLLVAGSTGSGKSVFINGLIGSLQLNRTPDQVKFVMIDPKMVEFIAYQDSPHLLLPVVTDVKRASITMQKVVVEMEKRYELFARAKARNIEQYNINHKDSPLQYIVIFIDEYADLMMTAKDTVEDTVQRITQMGRAAGIHLIMGTQRPSVDVVTGVIKSNLPSRVAFRLPSPHDFRTVMDGSGPHLLGAGDGVCVLNDGSQQRFQSAAVTGDDNESVAFIEAMNKYWRKHNPSTMSWSLENEKEESETGERDQGEDNQLSVMVQEHTFDIDKILDQSNETPSESAEQFEEGIESDISQDRSYELALQVAQKYQGISPLILQKTLRIDYITAARVVEQMARNGVVGEMNFEKGLRPWLQNELKETDDELLERMKLYICQTNSAKASELQSLLSIRKERILQLMGKLCEDGVLNPPTSPRAGYTLAWDEEQIEAYIADYQGEIV
jgi:DNA segregation ATPase FtsK/SpoIIIE-like protein